MRLKTLPPTKSKHQNVFYLQVKFVQRRVNKAYIRRDIQHLPWSIAIQEHCCATQFKEITFKFLFNTINQYFVNIYNTIYYHNGVII